MAFIWMADYLILSRSTWFLNLVNLLSTVLSVFTSQPEYNESLETLETVLTILKTVDWYIINTGFKTTTYLIVCTLSLTAFSYMLMASLVISRHLFYVINLICLIARHLQYCTQYCKKHVARLFISKFNKRRSSTLSKRRYDHRLVKLICAMSLSDIGTAFESYVNCYVQICTSTYTHQ